MKAASIGALIDRLHGIREEKKALNDKLKEVESRYRTLEADILERITKEDLPRAAGRKASVSRSENVVANLEDWDALTKFIKRTGNFHLLHRRISDPAFRELLALKGNVPGLSAFTKVGLNLTTLKE